jgi:hypothetical protein
MYEDYKVLLDVTPYHLVNSCDISGQFSASKIRQQEPEDGSSKTL